MRLFGWMGHQATKEYGFEPVIPSWLRGLKPSMPSRITFGKPTKSEEDDEPDDMVVAWRQDEPEMFKRWATPPKIKDRRRG